MKTLDRCGTTKEYARLAQASIKKSGGKLLAAGQNVIVSFWF